MTINIGTMYMLLDGILIITILVYLQLHSCFCLFSKFQTKVKFFRGGRSATFSSLFLQNWASTRTRISRAINNDVNKLGNLYLACQANLKKNNRILARPPLALWYTFKLWHRSFVICKMLKNLPKWFYHNSIISSQNFKCFIHLLFLLQKIFFSFSLCFLICCVQFSTLSSIWNLVSDVQVVNAKNVRSPIL